MMARDFRNFELSEFFPYQVRVFYAHVSSSIAAVYQAQYDVSPAEWRCLAILSAGSCLTAAEIVLRSSMDKVTVSRAISKLRQRKWVAERSNRKDKRSKLVSLTADGQDILADLMPKVMMVEKALLNDIDPDDLATFYKVVAQVSENSAALKSHDTR